MLSAPVERRERRWWRRTKMVLLFPVAVVFGTVVVGIFLLGDYAEAMVDFWRDFRKEWRNP